MQCIKCGQNVEDGSVFCKECLADMKNYPVRPGTVVQLPKYHENPTRWQPPKRKQGPTLEEQIKTLRKWARRLTIALAVSILLLLGACYLLLRTYSPEEKLLPGQNYSSATISDSDETER